MAKKSVKVEVQDITASTPTEIAVIPKTLISHGPVDFGNEGLNNLGKKLNEVIDHLNSM